MGLSASYIIGKKNMSKNTVKFGLTIGLLFRKKKELVEEEEEEAKRKRIPKGINWEMRIFRVCLLIK